MKRSIKKGLTYLVVGSALLFALRLLYGYATYPDRSSDAAQQTYQGNWDGLAGKRNIASKKLKLATPERGTTATVDQKYEKVGTLASRTSHFDEDEKQLYALIRDQNMLIQFEQRSGLPGYRTLNMALGVVPDKFDSITNEIKRIGTLLSIHINKVDKTNEYKELGAKRVSLEKTREALTQLKKQGGEVRDLVDLENRMLDIENQIQALGVRLGEFDEENEFCTVKFQLMEHVPAANSRISFLHRAKVAFEWTVVHYLLLLTAGFFGMLFVLVLLAVVQKIKWLQNRIGQIVTESRAA